MVRIPVHTGYYNQTPDYLTLLDQGISWAEEQGLYAIIDWHSIGDPVTDVYDMTWGDKHLTSWEKTKEFWRTIPKRYAGRSNVAFYELFNELTSWINGADTGSTWTDWRPMAEELIDLIRANEAQDAHTIVIVSNYRWDFQLTPIAADPVQRDNVAYSVHPYPGQIDYSQPASWVASWDTGFGFLTSTYPVFASELGYDTDCDPASDCPFAQGYADFGIALTQYFADHGVSFTPWLFRGPDGWPPRLLADWDYTPTNEGAFFRCVLQGATGCGTQGDVRPPVTAGWPTTSNFSWTAATDDTGVVSYEIWGQNLDTFAWTLVTTTTDLEYTMTNPSPGQPYAAEVRALDAAGNASYFGGGVQVF